MRYYAISVCEFLRWQVIILPLPYEYYLFPWHINFKRRLCIQPVRIRYRIRCLRYRYARFWWLRRVCIQYLYGQTGAGLPFGQPGATTQWGKVDVVFNYRAWKTISNSNFLVVSAASGGTSAEESSLLGRVDDSDCIEVFFIKRFSPSSAHGGGATWWTGTAGAKVITSDEQVRCSQTKAGVDITHLAHEVSRSIKRNTN